MTGTASPYPLILDTDIGDDIDDTWALIQLLKSPDIRLELITSCFGNTRYRTRLLARILSVLGRQDIPLGIGIHPRDLPGKQSAWLGDYRLDDYSGVVYDDGVQAIVDTIMHSPVPVTLLSIGPAMNIAEALKREPRITGNARFVGMQGSIFTGYAGDRKPSAEWNVKVDPAAFREVLAAPWDCTITPLDTCGLVRLRGARYRRVVDSRDPAVRLLMDNYRMWLPGADWLDPKPDPDQESTTLFDTVAVSLARSRDFLFMEDLPLQVTDDGFTVIDERHGHTVHCATAWTEQDAFEDHLVDILTG